MPRHKIRPLSPDVRQNLSFTCKICGKVWTGPGSRKAAEKCASSGRPVPRYEVGTIRRNNKNAYIILGYYIKRKNSDGRHIIYYKVEKCAYRKANGKWIRVKQNSSDKPESTLTYGYPHELNPEAITGKSVA